MILGPETQENTMSITGTTEKHLYILDNERYGECTLIRDWDKFAAEMVDSCYNEGIRRQVLAEREEIAAENGEECMDTLESLRDDYEEELFDAAKIVYCIRLHDDSIVWATADDYAYRAVDDGDAVASSASYAGDVADLLAVEEA